MIKFPSISQYRSVIRAVKNRVTYVGKDENDDPIYDNARPMPVLNYRGTVKLHGTNAAMVYDVHTEEITFQSRSREITLESDNAGFALFGLSKVDLICGAIKRGVAIRETTNKVVIFGEWCGGNIQKGVALNGLDKMFVIFKIKLIDDDEENNEWVPLDECQNSFNFSDDNIHVATKFGTYEMQIDFSNPELVQNDFIDLTMKVEAECPVGKHFGVSGIGEGIVWECVDEGWRSSEFWMKVKGEKHSVSKVKKLASVDVEAIESMNKFVESVVTEARLEQGFDHITNEMKLPFEMKSLGDFIRWVYNDVVKEETDTIVENQLDPKKLGGPLAKASKRWYINKLNEDTFS